MKARTLTILMIALAISAAPLTAWGQESKPATAASGPCANSDWPQLQGNPQRTGFTTNTVKPPFKVAWHRRFLPERIHSLVQAVIYQGRVFVGTEQGNLYALGAKDGKDRWKFACSSPILHTAACGDGKVVVSTLDGVYAVETDTGKLAWKFAGNPLYGFSAAPLIAEDTVFIGQRNGTFFALNLVDGKPRWDFKAGTPILDSAAYDAGQVFFCDEKLFLHCLDAKTGREIWKSEQLYGQSAKGYCPVIVNGFVIFRPMAACNSMSAMGMPDAHPAWSKEDREAVDKLMEQTKNEDLQKDILPAKLMEMQDKLVENFRQWPFRQDLFILDEKTGKQAFIAPHFPTVQSLPGGVAPPAWDGQHSIFLGYRFRGMSIYWGYNVNWGRFDLNRQRFVEVLPPKPVGTVKNPAPGEEDAGGWYFRFGTGSAPDETVNATVGGRMLFIMHCEECNCAFTGAYDLDKKLVHGLPAPGRKWEFYENAESGNNAASIADGYFYHITMHSLAAWTSAEGDAK